MKHFTSFMSVILACLALQASAFLPATPIKSAPSAAESRSNSPIVLNGSPDFFTMVSRFYNELVPWGDSSKGVWAGKRDAMVVKYMEKTGISKEEAEKEVDEYLKDRELYIAKKRLEEDAAKKKGQ